MNEAERIAFEHAAALCREYRAENKILRLWVVGLSAALVFAVIYIAEAI